MPLSPWGIKRGHFGDLLQELEAALLYRMTELGYEKAHDLRTVVARHRLLDRDGKPPDANTEEEFFRKRYDEYRAIGWLELPLWPEDL